MELDDRTADERALEIWEALDPEHRDAIVRALEKRRAEAAQVASAKGTREERFVSRLLAFAGQRGKSDGQGYRYFLIWYAKTHGERGVGLRRGKKSSAPPSVSSQRVAYLLRASLDSDALKDVDNAIQLNWDSVANNVSLKQMASEWRQEFIQDFLTPKEQDEYKNLIKSVLPPIYIPRFSWRHRHEAAASCLMQWSLLGLTALVGLSQPPIPSPYPNAPPFSAATTAAAPSPPVPSRDAAALSACAGNAKEHKRCLLGVAQQLRRSNFEASRDAYEAALAIDYDDSLQNALDTSRAFLGLTSLHLSRNDFKTAYASYERYMEHKRMHQTAGSDCVLRFLFASLFLNDEEALSAERTCAWNAEEDHAWPVTRSLVPKCHAELRKGLALDRLDRDAEAFHTYTYGLTQLLQTGAQGLRDEALSLKSGDWDNLGCEDNRRGELVERAKNVSKRLAQQGDLLWIDADAIARRRETNTLELVTVVFDPSAYGCNDDGRPIQSGIHLRRINGAEPTGRDAGALFSIDRLRIGANRVLADIDFYGDKTDLGCMARTLELSFCYTATARLLPADQCSKDSIR